VVGRSCEPWAAGEVSDSCRPGSWARGVMAQRQRLGRCCCVAAKGPGPGEARLRAPIATRRRGNPCHQIDQASRGARSPVARRKSAGERAQWGMWGHEALGDGCPAPRARPVGMCSQASCRTLVGSPARSAFRGGSGLAPASLSSLSDGSGSQALRMTCTSEASGRRGHAEIARRPEPQDLEGAMEFAPNPGAAIGIAGRAGSGFAHKPLPAPSALHGLPIVLEGPSRPVAGAQEAAQSVR